MRLRYGRALIRSEGRGADIVEQARDALLAAGAHESAAEADVALADVAWTEGRRENSLAGLQRAMALLADAPASAAKAYAWSRYAGFLMANGEEEEAIRIGREALAMTEALGLDEPGVNTLGEHRRRADVARRPCGARRSRPQPRAGDWLRSPVIARSHFNLGSTYANLGDLSRASSTTQAAPRRHGARASRRSSVGSRPSRSTSGTGAATGTARSSPLTS